VAPPERPSIRLLLVDDHEIVRMGLRTLFAQSQGIEVVGEAGSAAEAIGAAARLKPDVVLMDVRLQDSSGVDACREILSGRKSTRVLFLTSYLDEEAMLAAVFTGAQGYVLKEIGRDSLVRAVTAVAEGQSILDQAAVRAMVKKMHTLAEPRAAGAGESLSPQERRVLALVADGKTNKEIAATLKLSDKTVKNYLGNVFQKLRVHRRAGAAVAYSRHLAR
jgi:two-component system, NarL family, response regulator DevR